MESKRRRNTFLVGNRPEGGFEAEALGYSIFTFADDWNGIKYMIRDAVLCHFEDGEAPQTISIERVTDKEVIAV